MDTNFGKLILKSEEGPDQEFSLAKKTVTLGRANTNDIVLYDVLVSRDHARLEIDDKGITLRDLGSSNGTEINGVKVDRATLRPGDTIQVGSQELAYRIEDPKEDVGLTKIETHLQLNMTIQQEFLPKQINETKSPSLVVFTREKTFSVDLDDLDLVTIGRDENCTIHIDSPRVSRRHAEVSRVTGAFVLQDKDSTNGTVLKGQKVDYHVLEDGDVFNIGPAQVIFKAGFKQENLTITESKRSEADRRRTVVFLPGIMGSELWLGSERVWPSVKTIFSNPEIYKYPSDLPLEARNIVDEVVIVPNLVKQDQYNRLGDYLVEELSYTRGSDFHEFPYDWRQDVRITARQLGAFIETLPRSKPIIIVAHSLGTQVTRYYVENLGGHKRIERMILMGGPHRGAVKGLVSMLVAPDVLPFGLMGDRLRQILMTFPTSYQIFPDYPVGKDQEGRAINFLRETSWLEDDFQPLIKLAQEFRTELRHTTRIPTTSIFGYGIKTISDVTVQRDSQGRMLNVDYLSDNVGDGSVLEQSAFLQGSDIHPVHQHHGSIFIDNDVKMRLKLELTRPY